MGLSNSISMDIIKGLVDILVKILSCMWTCSSSWPIYQYELADLDLFLWKYYLIVTLLHQFRSNPYPDYQQEKREIRLFQSSIQMSDPQLYTNCPKNKCLGVAWVALLKPNVKNIYRLTIEDNILKSIK